MIKKFVHNVNELKDKSSDDINKKYYGSLIIDYYGDHFAFSFLDENKNLIDYSKKELDFNHKYTEIGKAIQQKFVPDSRIIFTNIHFTPYHISQPNFLFIRIWRKVFNEYLS